jgi:RimJ/RimL family protein N-acetyltransferase
MIEIHQASFEQLGDFVEMERDNDTAKYILPTSSQQHQANFAQADTIYLSIMQREELVGYFILAPEPDSDSVEFRRVVIAHKGRGIGQQAIPEMEKFCARTLNCKRIWLDVYDFNSRGIHLYEKLGYRRFDQGDFEGKHLFFYEKQL